MTNRVSFLSLLSGCSLLVSVGLASSAVQAGFEWVPAQAAPPAVQKQQEVIIPEPEYMAPAPSHSEAPMAAPVTAMHHVAVTPEEGEELIEDAAMHATNDAHVAVENDAEAQEDIVVDTVDAEIEVEIVEEVVVAEDVTEDIVEETPAEVVTYEQTMPLKTYALAYGFGKEMPLALALRQIVPASYAFSFDPKVNIGTRVSWQGGEPWNVVLKKALGDEKITATVYDDMVFVRPATDAEHKAVKNMHAEHAAPASAAPATLVEAEAVPAYFDDAHSWSATPGQTLRSVLSAWSDKVDVKLHWNNVYDYAIVNPWTYQGDYVHAVDGLLTAFESETPKPTGNLHPNAPEGPAVLVVGVANAE
jgi:hypothetical protein